MTSRSQWLLYGATGYTGRRIAEAAVAKGFRPVLAGRNATEVEALARRLSLDWHVVDLTDSAALNALVAGFSTVLNAAGPFAQTWRPMAEACIAQGAHCLDITGEVAVYEGMASLDAEARRAGVMLLPGCGFDVVPSDCLALQLKRRLPDATRIDIGISFDGTLSQGTIRSALGAANPKPQARRQHRLVRLPEPLARAFDFGPGHCGGRAVCHAASFGDISMAWRSTGIADVTTYLRPIQAFATLAALKSVAEVDALPVGPSDAELAGIPSLFVAEARNAEGQAVAMRLETPQVYAITFDLASTIAQLVHEGVHRPGFQTPAVLFGEDFILDFEGCRLQDWPAEALT